MEKRSGVIYALVLGVVAFLAFGGVSTATDETPAPTGTTAAEAAEATGDVPVSVAGMTVFIDPETGQLRPPTADEAAALAAALEELFGPASLAPPEEIFLKEGGVAVDVGLSQLDFSVATVGADGVEFHCLDSAHSAKEHIHHQTAATEEK